VVGTLKIGDDRERRDATLIVTLLITPSISLLWRIVFRCAVMRSEQPKA
jgi:hypothetical protein